MEEDKNIRLTVVRQAEEEDEISIDLSVAAACLRRMFTVWLAAAVAAGAIVSGMGFLLRDRLQTSQVHAVIMFSSGGGFSLGSLDTQTITSSNVVAGALDALGISPEESDNIRTNLGIEGIVPDSVIDQRVLFYKIFSDTSGQGLTAAEKLLGTDYTTNRYVLTFNFQKAGYTRQEGTAILNAVIDSYRSYFTETYTNRPLLGSFTNVIDYRDYDYPEAVDIFDDSLKSISAFLRRYSSEASFRSSTTGYTVADLLRQTTSIYELELARVTAYITQHCVTRQSVDNVISHYEWKMEENRRLRAVQETRLESLIAAADSYQKDPLLYVVSETGALQGPGGELNGIYDDLVKDILSTQTEISRITERNRFYQSVVDRFWENSAASEELTERADRDLAELDQKIRNLIEVVNLTMDDYFDTTLSSLFLVQMPAVAELPQTLSPALVKAIVITEALLLLAYFSAAGFQTLHAAASESAEKKRLRKAQSAGK